MSEALERITDCWWPIPAAGTLAAIVLAAVFLGLDQMLQPSPVRALSPAVNDPTTAVQCIDRIHAILHRLAGRRLDVGCTATTTARRG